MNNLEQKLEKLENLVNSLDKEASIERSLQIFNEGINLSKECLDELKEHKGKLQLLKDNLDKLDMDDNLDD